MDKIKDLYIQQANYQDENISEINFYRPVYSIPHQRKESILIEYKSDIYYFKVQKPESEAGLEENAISIGKLENALNYMEKSGIKSLEKIDFNDEQALAVESMIENFDRLQKAEKMSLTLKGPKL